MGLNSYVNSDARLLKKKVCQESKQKHFNHQNRTEVDTLWGS